VGNRIEAQAGLIVDHCSCLFARKSWAFRLLLDARLRQFANGDQNLR
jgi:hypothetical protein